MFGEGKVRNLITGIIVLFVAIALILWTYGFLSGMATSEGDIVMTREGIRNVPIIMLVILFFGLWGGFEIGRYVQTEFTKRREQRLKSA